MKTSSPLELLSEGESPLQAVFENDQDYEQFCLDFQTQVKQRLDELAEARRASEQEAMRRWYR
jgi:hypothetical protein